MSTFARMITLFRLPVHRGPGGTDVTADPVTATPLTGLRSRRRRCTSAAGRPLPDTGRMDVPGPLATWCGRWALTPDGRPMTGGNAIVLPVVTRRGRRAVLRVGRPDNDDATAWRALQVWRGAGAVELLRHDVDANVSLLERLDHRRTLDSLPVEEAIVVAPDCERT